jgi:CRP/FNR family transcriptional regulator, nitrogen fixation regulation protein
LSEYRAAARASSLSLGAEENAMQHAPATPTAKSAHAALQMITLGPVLLVHGVLMHFSRDEEIFGEDEPSDYVYCVISGAVRTMCFSTDGRRQILGFHLAGDVFGLEHDATHTASAEAVADAGIVLVRRSLIDKTIREHPAAAQDLFALAAQSMREARDHALILGRKGAGRRLAAFLLRLVDRDAARGELDLPMSRADIADYLGLTIETVSRAFTDMERRRAIDLPSSRHVVVRSRTALCQLEAA